MMNRLLTAGAIALLSITPALAISPNCEAQLSQIKAELARQPTAQVQSLTPKYQQAEQLCAAKQEMEAQRLAQEIREEMQKTAP